MVLRQNWREGQRDGVDYAYTCPSPSYYPYQWYWDSCFCAIARRKSDPKRARQELLTLLKAQHEDGFIPHTVFWDGRVRLSRVGIYNIQHLSDKGTSTIQPPLLAWAWELVAAESGDQAEEFIRAGVEPLKRHYDWLQRERDLDDDGLISIIQPDESGLDGSPKFDSIWGWRGWGRPGQALGVWRNRRLGFNARRIAAKFDYHQEEVLTNVMYKMGLDSLARLLGEAGKPYTERAEKTLWALVDNCYDESTGLFFDLVGEDERMLRVNTWSSLAPLIMPDCPKDIARRLVEHLMNSREYHTPVPIPSVATNEPSFRAGDRGLLLHRYWRGPSWVNTTWLLIPAMRRLGYAAEAERLLRPLLKAVTKSGMREYYDARSGEGLGAKDFAWSTLVLDLIPGETGP